MQLLNYSVPTFVGIHIGNLQRQHFKQGLLINLLETLLNGLNTLLQKVRVQNLLNYLHWIP